MMSLDLSFFLLLFLLQYSARTMKHAPLNQGNDEFSGNLLLQMKKKIGVNHFRNKRTEFVILYHVHPIFITE
jgi:hypothetical protein